MDPKYFIQAKKGFVNIFLDVREISHVVIRNSPSCNTCEVSMKNGEVLTVDENLFTEQLEIQAKNNKSNEQL